MQNEVLLFTALSITFTYLSEPRIALIKMLSVKPLQTEDRNALWKCLRLLKPCGRGKKFLIWNVWKIALGIHKAVVLIKANPIVSPTSLTISLFRTFCVHGSGRIYRFVCNFHGNLLCFHRVLLCINYSIKWILYSWLLIVYQCIFCLILWTRIDCKWKVIFSCCVWSTKKIPTLSKSTQVF